MTTHWLRLTLLPAALLAFGSAAHASVDTSPKPGGVYRLKPGIYVAKDSPCESAANAAIRQYDGRGLSTAHSHACKVRVLSHKGQRYTVDQSCLDTGTGPGRRYTERQQVRVQDALSFTQVIHGAATTYRYCPVYQLPPDLRRAAQ